MSCDVNHFTICVFVKLSYLREYYVLQELIHKLMWDGLAVPTLDSTPFMYKLTFSYVSLFCLLYYGWCSGYPCLAPMGPVGPGFDSRYGLYVQMVSQSMLALAGFLQDLRFPPVFKIGMCLEISKHPFTHDVWGAAVLNVDVTI